MLQVIIECWFLALIISVRRTSSTPFGLNFVINANYSYQQPENYAEFFDNWKNLQTNV